MGQVFNENGDNYKNVTLKNIIEFFRETANRNAGIKTFTFGDIWEIDLVETDYALAHLSIESANYSINELEYNFKLYVMDLVSKDESNENDVLSDTLQIIGDFISTLQNDRTIFQNVEWDYRTKEQVNCTPFTERFDNEVSGWVGDFSIVVSFDYSACTGDTMNINNGR